LRTRHYDVAVVVKNLEVEFLDGDRRKAPFLCNDNVDMTFVQFAERHVRWRDCMMNHNMRIASREPIDDFGTSVMR